MATATAAQRATFEAQLGEVERQYRAALFRHGLATIFDPVAMMGPLSLLLPAWMDDEQERLATELETIRKEIDTARNRYLPWAIAGKRADGTTYSSSLFALAVRDLAVRIEAASGETWNRTVFGVASNAAHDTATTAKDAANEALKFVTDSLPDEQERERWLRYAKVGGVVGLGLLTVVAVGYGVRAFR